MVVFPALVAIGTRATPSESWVKFAVWLGAVSFPLYAIHYPLYRLADVAFARLGIPDSLEVPLAGAAIMALATLAFYGFDVEVRAALSRRLMPQHDAATPISIEPAPRALE